MRIRVSATEAFFTLDRFKYEAFQEKLAAFAAGLVGFKQTEKSSVDLVDVQVNTNVIAMPMRQYVFDPRPSEGNFTESPKGQSDISIEIDHISEVLDEKSEKLLCVVAIALVKHFYPDSNHPNCWSKRYGGSQTGWYDGDFSEDMARQIDQLILRFVAGNLDAAAMVKAIGDLVLASDSLR